MQQQCYKNPVEMPETLCYHKAMATTAQLSAQNRKLKLRLANLEAQNEALKKRVAELEGEVASLNKALAEARSALLAQKRASKRQAAPFSRGKKEDKPRKPGRKKGHKATHRPVPERVDREVDVPLVQPYCLYCGGELETRRIMPQYQIDIPPVEPVITRFNVETARCACCGRRAQGRNPQQISDALGAANIHFGPRLLSFAAEVKHALGVPYEKVTRILEKGFGIKVSPASLARASQRIAAKAEPTYKQLILELRGEEVVGGDETSWRINGDKAWLWVFTSSRIALYTIDPSRAGAVVEEILGSDFKGTLVTDCFIAYDPLPYQQQKCFAHFLRRCKDNIALPSFSPALTLSYRLLWLLRGAISLRNSKETLPPETYAQDCKRLEAAFDRLIQSVSPDEEDDEARRFAKLLRKQRHRLFLFLYIDAVPYTNNAAERALRPAVIARKLSAGNRSDKGVKAHAIILSIHQTCQLLDIEFQDIITQILHQSSPETISLLEYAGVSDQKAPPLPP
jgi:transposase